LYLVTQYTVKNIIKPNYIGFVLIFILMGCIEILAQNSIHGIVLDTNNKPYTGANVLLNDTRGSVSDAKGEFLFQNILNDNYTIKVTALGYKDVLINGKTDTTNSNIRIVLMPAVKELEEIHVNGNRGMKLKKSESISIQLIEEAFLKEAKASSLMQTLNTIPGINSIDIGTGISKPMIRGLGYYRVIIAQNGIRQEGQQWSDHHGVSIDQHAVEHIEIIKGPASLQYGSGAMGGVINVVPEHVPLTSGISGEVLFTAKSNTKWLGSSAELSYRKGDVYSNLALTYNSYGDLLIPETDSFSIPSPGSSLESSHQAVLGNQMHNTAGTERAVSLSAGIIKSWGNSYFQFNYHSTKTGFFDWQGIQNNSTKLLHQKNSRDINHPFQQVQNYSIQHFTNRFFKADKLELAFSYQFNDVKEFKPFINKYGIRTKDYNYYKSRNYYDLGLFLHTFTANSVYALKRIANHTIKVGFNNQLQFHNKDGYNHILPEYQRFSTALFATHQFKLSKKWILNSGARIDYTFFEMQEMQNLEFPDNKLDSIFNPDFKKVYPGTAFSLGMNYLPNNRTVFKMHLGKSFRAPSAYELSAYGLHTHANRVEKGNVSNKSEQAWQLDIGLEQKWKDISLSISPFVNYFTNYLFLEPTPEFTDGGGGQIYEYKQTNALLYGAEASFDFAIQNKFVFKSGAEYVYAVNLDLESALPFTPPFSIRNEISYLFANTRTFTKNKVGVEVVRIASQNYTVTNELSTPGYTTVNLHAQTEIILGLQKINLMLKVRNLFNTSYYNHISFYRRMRIPEPARDFQLFISVPIN
jgi:iron complex outermembrane receptor protein